MSGTGASARDPDARSALDYSRIFSAFSLLSGATVAAMALGVVTNKVIASTAGPSGIALLGLFRNLAAWVSGMGTLGFGITLMRQASVARGPGDGAKALGAAGLLLAGQTLAVLAVAAVGAPFFAARLFGIADAARVSNVRIVLLLAVVNLSLQMMLNLLRGLGALREISLVQLATAAGTLGLIVPMLRLGDLGLALTIGTGPAVGCVFALVGLGRARLREAAAVGWRTAASLLKELLPSSLLNAVPICVQLGAALSVQALILKGRGLEPLGFYQSSLIILESGELFLMSWARTYLLSTAGAIADERLKARLVSRMVWILIPACTASSLFFILASKWVTLAFFSSRFLAGGALMATMSLALLGKAHGWIFNTFMLHKGEHSRFVAIETAPSLLLVALAWYGSARAMPLEYFAWSYTAAYLVLGGLYGIVIAVRHGPRFLGEGYPALMGACLLALGSARLFADRGGWPWAALCAAALGFLGFRLAGRYGAAAEGTRKEEPGTA